MKKKLLACLTTCSLLIAMFASTMTVNATSQTIKPIYQNELNQAGRNSQTSRGINIDAYVSASLNGVTSNSARQQIIHMAAHLLPHMYIVQLRMLAIS